LNGAGLQVGEHEEQPIFRRCQRAGPIDGEPAGGSRFAIEAPRRHVVLERRLEGRDQGLKLLQGQTGEVQELRGAGLHVSEPYSSHGSCLLSRHGSITDASILLIGINSTELFSEHTAPELLYLETRWGSLISFGMTAALLKDVLPVAGTPETVRQHLHRVAARQDAELGTRQRGLIDDGPAADQPLPVPREAIIVGSDGGYLRNWYDKRKKFEVIVGKSMAEDRDDRYFGLVRSQGDAPKLRFCEVLRAQGLPADQAVTVLTDGGDSVRALVGDLPAGTEHYLDWFRAT
jgi:hypothetical protein